MLSLLRRLPHLNFPSLLFLSGIGLTLVRVHSIGALLMAAGVIVYVWRGSIRRCTNLGREALAEFAIYWQKGRQWAGERRTLAKTPAWLQLAWYVVTMLWILAFFVPIIRSGQVLQRPLAEGLALISLLLGILEWFLRVLIFVRWTWARVVGKILLGTTAALLACLASAWARHFTFQLTGEDPASFLSFSAFMTALLVPLVWWGFLCIVAIFFAGLEVIGRVLMFLARHWARSAGTTGEDGFTPIDSLAGTLRAGSALFAAALLYSLTPHLDPANNPQLRQAATVVLVGLEYWERPTCMSPRPLPAAKLDSSHYSLATEASGAVTLRTVTCPVTGNQ